MRSMLRVPALLAGPAALAALGITGRLAYSLAVQHGRDLLEIDSLRRRAWGLAGVSDSVEATGMYARLESDSTTGYEDPGIQCITFHGMYLEVDDLRRRRARIQADLDNREFEMCGMLRRGDRCLLAGAGMGTVAVWACLHAGVENVLMYEAIPDKVNALQNDVGVNGTTLNVRWGALATYDGEADFTVYHPHWGGSSLSSHRDVYGEDTDMSRSVIRVPTVDTERILREWDANALMLDVEGEEHHILRSIDLNRLRCVGLEIHGSREKMREVRQLLVDCGFEIVYFVDHAPILQQHIGAVRRDASKDRESRDDG